MATERIDVLAVMARKRAPFRDAGMRRVYDGCVAAYREKGCAYMAEGNSAAAMFRRGFTGAHAGTWDAASRKTVAYAQFRAGEDCAHDEARAAVAELIEATKDFVEVRTHNGPRMHYGPVESERLHAALARVGGA